LINSELTFGHIKDTLRLYRKKMVYCPRFMHSIYSAVYQYITNSIDQIDPVK